MRIRFTKGDRVEVERVIFGAPAYFPATVASTPLGSKNAVLVEFESLTVGQSVRFKEYIEPKCVRPAPPREINQCFTSGEEVDAFRDCEGCWIKGNVKVILEDSRYLVDVGGGDDHRVIEVNQFNLRVHREWDDGEWVPPYLQQDNAAEEKPTPKVRKLIIRFSRGNPNKCYEKGAMVEVRSDEEGYRGSWYTGRIFVCLESNKYIVEYLTLRRDDDELIPLRELTEEQYIRPSPPPLSPVIKYKTGDEVDAWHNEGWWVGTVYKVLDGSDYIVYFNPTGEKLVFPHSSLRLHQDWINGQWVISDKVQGCSNSQPKRCKSKHKEPKSSMEQDGKQEIKFGKGMKVEIRSDEQGYEGAWFSGKIIGYLDDEKYMVEYNTLMTEDESMFLREETKACDIRPYPPMIQRVYSYELYEFVDAWYNDGWWSGQVSKVTDGVMMYSVYFQTSNEELEFDHSDLRPHQEWKNGEWVAAPQRCSCKWMCGNVEI